MISQKAGTCNNVIYIVADTLNEKENFNVFCE